MDRRNATASGVVQLIRIKLIRLLLCPHPRVEVDMIRVVGGDKRRKTKKEEGADRLHNG